MGELLTVEQVWGLSKRWYADRLRPEFTGRTIAEAHQIFEDLDLTSNFWRFESGG